VVRRRISQPAELAEGRRTSGRRGQAGGMAGDAGGGARPPPRGDEDEEGGMYDMWDPLNHKVYDMWVGPTNKLKSTISFLQPNKKRRLEPSPK
jgi:hypothetical protein